tara:strand:+ start:206 stop:523 length:318 start_codon:yes stop_codon:yes gene_type:complete
MLLSKSGNVGGDSVVITPAFHNNSPKPEHYNKGVSPYEVAETMFGADGLLQYVLINAIKYIQRYPHKYAGEPVMQLADLKKARQSLDKAIELHEELYPDQKLRHG